MANWNLYTESEDQFLIENCIEGDMTYKEAADHLGRSNAKVISARIAKLKDIHNFKKNTIQKASANKAETANEIPKKAESDTVASEKPALTNTEFNEMLVKLATQDQPLPELDELESIPYVAVPMDNSFGEAVNIALALADVFGEEIKRFGFNGSTGNVTIAFGGKIVSISEEASDDEE